MKPNPLEREHDIQRAILEFLLRAYPKAHWWPNKTVGTSGLARRKNTTYRGAGDIMGCYKGRHIEFEVKTKRGTQSDDQKRHQERIEVAGGRYYVVRNIDDVQKAMEDAR